MSERAYHQDVPSIGDIKDMMAEISQTALANAHLMETDRPYSSLPPSRHPVWSDELRLASAELRDEGLLGGTTVHPWEADLARWPSANPDHQAQLLEQTVERQEWAAIQAEFTADPTNDPDITDSDANAWSVGGGIERDVRSDQVITAVDMIRDYGHQEAEPAEELTLGHAPSQGESLSLRYANALRSLYDLPALSRQEIDTSQGMEY